MFRRLQTPRARRSASASTAMARVRRAVRVVTGVTELAIEGKTRAERVTWRRGGGAPVTVPVDHVLLHRGVVPNPNLAAAAGCALDWNEVQARFRPRVDAWGGDVAARDPTRRRRRARLPLREGDGPHPARDGRAPAGARSEPDEDPPALRDGPLPGTALRADGDGGDRRPARHPAGGGRHLPPANAGEAGDGRGAGRVAELGRRSARRRAVTAGWPVGRPGRPRCGAQPPGERATRAWAGIRAVAAPPRAVLRDPSAAPVPDATVAASPPLTGSIPEIYLVIDK